MDQTKTENQKFYLPLDFLLQLLAQRIAFKAHTQECIPIPLASSFGRKSPDTLPNLFHKLVSCSLHENAQSGNAETRRHKSNLIAAYAPILPLDLGLCDSPSFRGSGHNGVD